MLPRCAMGFSRKSCKPSKKEGARMGATAFEFHDREKFLSTPDQTQGVQIFDFRFLILTMARTILISMLDGLLVWLGMVSAIWLGYSRWVWKWPVALGLAWAFMSLVRRRLNRTLQSRAANSASEEQRTELELRKPSVGATLCLAAVLCIAGVIIRYTRSSH